MAPNLESLPEELVEMIFDHVKSDEDKLSLRLVSRSLEHKTFFRFVRTYFSHSRVMLTRPAIQRFLDISKTTRLAPHMNRICINLAVLENEFRKDDEDEESDDDEDASEDSSDDNNHNDGWSHTTREEKNAYLEHRANQQYLLTNELYSTVYPTFLQAFRNFSNYKTISFAFHTDDYGSTLVKRSSGRFLKIQDWYECLGMSNRIFNLTLCALGESQTPVDRVTLCENLDVKNNGPSLSGEAFYCPDMRRTYFASAVSNLTSVSLELALHPEAFIQPFGSGFANFISSAGALRDLTLSFQRISWPERMEKFLRDIWLPANTDLRHLTKLSVRSEGIVSQTTLIAFLRTLKTALVDLHLSGIALAKGTWEEVLVLVRDEFNLTRLELASCGTLATMATPNTTLFLRRGESIQPFTATDISNRGRRQRDGYGLSKEEVAYFLHSSLQMKQWLDRAIPRLLHLSVWDLSRFRLSRPAFAPDRPKLPGVSVPEYGIMLPRTPSGTTWPVPSTAGTLTRRSKMEEISRRFGS